MRYEYTITKEGGEAEIMKAMSWKKLLKVSCSSILNSVAGVPILIRRDTYKQEPLEKGKKRENEKENTSRSKRGQR